MSKIMFSIVVPAYNAAQFINRSIDSILRQKDENFEIIVVDDGSEDDTIDIIKNIINDKIRVVSQKNTGVSGARNTGISMAKGDYICFLDADDVYYENHLSVLHEMIIENPEEVFFVTGFRNILLSGKTQDILVAYEDSKSHVEVDFYDVVRRHGTFYNTNCFCVKKAIFKQIGMFEIGVAQGEDTDMWYRLGAYYSVVVSPIVTNARYRDFSVATRNRVLNYNWYFERRVQGILADPQVPGYRKKSLLFDIEDRKITKVRHKLLEHKNKDALSIFKTINARKVSLKRYLITLGCFFLPHVVLEKYVDRRDTGYY